MFVGVQKMGARYTVRPRISGDRDARNTGVAGGDRDDSGVVESSGSTPFITLLHKMLLLLLKNEKAKELSGL